MEKIIFFHMNQLGDFLFSLPVLAAARREWPDKKLYSVVRPELATLLESAGVVDDVVPRRRNSLSATLELRRWLKNEGFSSAILFSESPKTCLLASMAGIPSRTGFSTASFSFLLTDSANRKGVPSLANNTALAKKAGLGYVPLDYTGILKIPAAEQDRIHAWFAANRVNADKMLLLAPGASKRRAEKHWPADRWKELISMLVKQGITPVLVGSPAERPYLEHLSKHAAPQSRVFTAPDGILSLAALMEQSKALVGIDSGAVHLAAALKVPVIALYGPTDPKQIGPQPLLRHRVIKKPMMSDIRVEDVWKEISRQLVIL